MFFDDIELRDGNYKVESLWVRIRGKANRTEILMGVNHHNHYSQSNQNEEMGEAFCKQLA